MILMRVETAGKLCLSSCRDRVQVPVHAVADHHALGEPLDVDVRGPLADGLDQDAVDQVDRPGRRWPACPGAASRPGPRPGRLGPAPEPTAREPARPGSPPARCGRSGRKSPPSGGSSASSPAAAVRSVAHADQDGIHALPQLDHRVVLDVFQGILLRAFGQGLESAMAAGAFHVCRSPANRRYSRSRVRSGPPPPAAVFHAGHDVDHDLGVLQGLWVLEQVAEQGDVAEHRHLSPGVVLAHQPADHHRLAGSGAGQGVHDVLGGRGQVPLAGVGAPLGDGGSSPSW